MTRDEEIRRAAGKVGIRDNKVHDNNGFATLRDDDNKPIQVTHWMRIEPPAVISNVERTGKNWKGGEQ